MIRGMTGFGSAQFSMDQVKGVVEIKSLNHRYFDPSFYLPGGFGSLENKIQQLVGSQVRRGRVTIALKITHKASSAISINRDTVKKYLNQAKQLKKEFGLENNLTLADVIKMPGVVDVFEEILDIERLWPHIERGIKISLKSVVQMRKGEGRSLSADIREHLKRMQLQITDIKKQSRNILSLKRKQMSEEEFSAFQKSEDIGEELSRLTHYMDEMRKLLLSDVSVGKKIDFVAQEMQRETNTIGSKLQDKIVANAVISIKSRIEKIREQAQNIE
jgi:uncharacterized protein (TIGR00255 family)